MITEHMTFDYAGQFIGSADLVESLAREGFQRRARMDAMRRAGAEDMLSLISEVRGGEDPTLLREAFYPRYEYIQQEVAARYPNLIRMRETMTTSDFTAYLTTDLLNIMLWGGFTQSTVAVMPLVKKTTLDDFRTVKRFIIDGDGQPFVEDKSDGSTPAPQMALTPRTPITYDPKSYSKKMSINWKALFNDHFGIFEQLTDWLVRGWNNTIWSLITNAYWDANGPNANVFTTAAKNQILIANGASVDNPILSFQGIADGYTVLQRQLGPDGQPIDFPGTLYLVVGPALEITAKAIKKSTNNQISVLGGKLNASGFPETRLNVGSGVIPDFEVIVDKRIPLVATSGTKANTGWMLIYDVQVQNRPTVELGMMREFDTPTIMQRAPNTMRVGGGIDARMGAFDSGQIDYKSVLVMGSAYGNAQNAVASVGQ